MVSDAFVQPYLIEMMKDVQCLTAAGILWVEQQNGRGTTDAVRQDKIFLHSTSGEEATQVAQPITAKPSQKREKQSCESCAVKEDRQMDEYQNAMEELRDIVEGISKLRDAAYTHYSLLVEQVLKDRITDEQQLERIMDGLCDFCDEIRFIELYRSLCRHIYYQYPQLVGEHMALFRALFEGPDEN